MLCSEGEAKFKPLFTHTVKKTWSYKDKADALYQYPLPVKNNSVSVRLKQTCQEHAC